MFLVFLFFIGGGGVVLRQQEGTISDNVLIPIKKAYILLKSLDCSSNYSQSNEDKGRLIIDLFSTFPLLISKIFSSI